MMKLLPVLSFFLFVSCRTEPKAERYSTPLEKLVEGNDRFVKGKPVHPDETLERIRLLKKGQEPFVVIVSCSDSRVPPELIFDQGFGDIFSIRTAGNVIGDYEFGSIEYAVEHLHCSLVVVLGHEGCGAIRAYLEHSGEKKDDHIQKIIDHISAEEEEKILPDSLKHNIDYAITANIHHGVNSLKQSEPMLKEKNKKNIIQIVGALYDLDTGKVVFMN